MHIPVQGTCHPSVRNNFFFPGSFTSFCSFTFGTGVFGLGLELEALFCI